MKLRIAVVGPCASGKTELVQALCARGYDARQCVQEHSYVPTMWQRISRPDVLIYLDAELSTITRRQGTDWDERLLTEQRLRLSHARTTCDLYLRTDTLSREEVVQAVLDFLKSSSYEENYNERRHSDEVLSYHNRLMALLDITRQLTAETDLDKLLKLIVSRTTKLLGAERTTLYLLDRESGELCSKIAEGTITIRLSVGQGLAGYVAQTGKVINVQDVQQDPRHASHFEQLTGYPVHTMLAAPMRDRAGYITGVAQVLNKRVGVFTAEDEELLTALTSSAAIALENAQLHTQVQSMLNSLTNTLAAIIDTRDRQMAGHSQRVTDYAVAIASRMGLPDDRIELVRVAGLLHDVGKIGVPEAVLTKASDLTPEERYIMRDHARLTREILAKVHFSDDLREVPIIAAQHHERLDGSGYPDGLRAEELSLESRILAVADVFDALTSHRYYREPVSDQEALAELEWGAGALFDSEVIETLKQLVADGEVHHD
jgi:putative nucleotidyltransferase with HDIG domain